MNHRITIFAALLVWPLAALYAEDAPTPTLPSKPNILVILSDDQRYDCIGVLNPRIHTPNLDRLAKQGVLFNNCYFMGGNVPAVCTPSRTMLMSGRTLFHLPNDIKAEGNKPSVPVMSTVFSQAGYDTFYCGKHGNTYHPADCSFDKTVFINAPLLKDPKQLLDEEVTAKEVANRRTYAPHVVSWLAEPERAKKPFFIFYAPSIPHDPIYPEPEDLALYTGDNRPLLPPNAARDHAEIAGFNLHDTNVRTFQVPGMGEFLTPLDLSQWRDVMARYCAYVTSLDRQVGQILDELEHIGAAENTIIVFASDNGLSLSDLGLIHKQSAYEEDIRVPLIVCGPGIPAGQRSAALVYLSDVFPTLCQQIDVPIPQTVEMKSFLPSLADPGKPHRTTMYFAYREEMRAFRDDQYKIILVDNHRVQLFDLKADQFEMHNLADKPEQAERISRMTKQAREAGRQLGEDPDTSVFWRTLDGKIAGPKPKPAGE